VVFSSVSLSVNEPFFPVFNWPLNIIYAFQKVDVLRQLQQPIISHHRCC